MAVATRHDVEKEQPVPENEPVEESEPDQYERIDDGSEPTVQREVPNPPPPPVEKPKD